jgi:hypothetical protein
MKVRELFETASLGRGYGSLLLDDKSSNKLTRILSDLGIKNIITKFHVTVIYDESNPKLEVKVTPDKKYKAAISDIKLMGEPGTKWYAIALTLKSPDIEKVHNKYITAGFKHSYPNFQAHLSLKYKPSPKDIRIIKDSFSKLKALELNFSNEKLEAIRE